MSRPGILDTLTEDQQQQLLAWIELLPLATVLDNVAAPPPGGFGIKTHPTSLRRFAQRARLQELREQLETAPSCTPGEADTLRQATATALTQHTFQIATAPNFHGQDLGSAVRWIVALREQEIRSEKIRLTRERLALDRQKLELAAALKEASCRTQYQEDKIKNAIAAILPPRHSDPFQAGPPDGSPQPPSSHEK